MSNLTLVIFGITSNLAQIKLIPALYDIAEKNLLPKQTKIYGVARSPKSKKDLKNYLWQVLHSNNKSHPHPIKKDIFDKLCQSFYHVDGHLDDLNFYKSLSQKIKQKSKKQNLLFYLATYPDLYQQVFTGLKSVGLNKEDLCWSRILIEKPMGNDLISSQKLNSLLSQYFKEEQIYRLDHYLGKETLQNILTFRFSNEFFEPLMNNQFIDHIQITSSENFSIGERGGYYDGVGALKDVGQNHLLQMLTFATMEAPREFTNNAVTTERIKILTNLIPSPNSLVLGQYKGYLKEKNVSSKSKTDTFFAFKTQIQNERYKGIPIYIRAGKMLKETVTEVSIIFKVPVNRLFKQLGRGHEPNVLIYRIQPNEGIILKILTKKPGHQVVPEPEFMQFCYPQRLDKHHLPDAYEKLLVDALNGDQTFFNDAQEVEAQWRFIDGLKSHKTKINIYSPNSWGPKNADELIQKDQRVWLEPSIDFCRI